MASKFNTNSCTNRFLLTLKSVHLFFCIDLQLCFLIIFYFILIVLLTFATTAFPYRFSFDSASNYKCSLEHLVTFYFLLNFIKRKHCSLIDFLFSPVLFFQFPNYEKVIFTSEMSVFWVFVTVIAKNCKITEITNLMCSKY